MEASQTAEKLAELAEIERLMALLYQVSTRLARLLDARKLGGGWTAEQQAEVKQLLEEEDALREKLHAAGGPSWDSSRRWVD